MRYRFMTDFTFDLTAPQKQLCAWVAERASAGVRRVTYDDAQAALGIPGDREITRILREIRERVDEVHTMVEFPILNTAVPYFDIHRNADYIWDDYCRGEQEHFYPGCQDDTCEIQDLEHAPHDRVVCCV